MKLIGRICIFTGIILGFSCGTWDNLLWHTGSVVSMHRLSCPAAGGMWDLVFLTRDQTCTPCIESTESQPLGHHGSPSPTSCFHVLLVSMLTCRHKLPVHSLLTVEPQSPPLACGGAHADVGGGERLQSVAPWDRPLCHLLLQPLTPSGLYTQKPCPSIRYN